MRISIKTELINDMGSMFIVIRDEHKDYIEYVVENQSKYFDMIYGQFINTSTTPLKFANIKV